MTQIVFLRALRAIQNGKGPKEHESGWLWRIVTNVIIDFYRWRGRLPECVELDAEHRRSEGDADGYLKQELEAELLTAFGMEPEEIAEQNYTVDLVRTAIEKLPTAKQSDAMHLQLDGYRNAEIAEMLQMTEIGVKQTHIRARANLRERLQDAA
jgi:RNA polymerase sigma factor (sigma-70 family)